MTTVALVAALAAVLWVSPAAVHRLRDLDLSPPRDQTPGGATGAPPLIEPKTRHGLSGGRASGGRASGGRRWWTAPWLSAVVTALTVNVVVGGVTGLVTGVLAGGAVMTLLRHTSTASEMRRRARVVADLPLLVDLLVACVAAGRAPNQALAVVAASVGGPIAEELAPVCARLELGTDAQTVWSELAGHDALAPLGRALTRSARTGSSITSMLSRCAEDLRRDRRAMADADARKVGVRATAPLGACFLPAFFLIGIVPTIVGGIGSMRW